MESGAILPEFWCWRKRDLRQDTETISVSSLLRLQGTFLVVRGHHVTSVVHDIIYVVHALRGCLEQQQQCWIKGTINMTSSAKLPEISLLAGLS